MVVSLPNADYHLHPSLSSSQLKLAYNNIELFKSRVIDKVGGFKSSPAMKLGTMFHEMVLEPDIFKPIIYPADKIDKRTKAYKSFLVENELEGDEDNLITQGEMDKLTQMKSKLDSHPECPDFSKTTNEASYFFKWGKHSLRVRPDAADLENNIIYDVKTTSSPIGKLDFYHHMNKYDYDLSAAMYIQALSAHTGTPWSFCFVVAQTVEPYSSALYWLGDSLFYQGFSKYKKGLKAIEKAEAYGSYSFQPVSQVLETFREVEKFDASMYYRPRNNANLGVIK